MDDEENTKNYHLQWHPAFLPKSKLNLNEKETDALIFENKYQLRTKLKEIDILIIKKMLIVKLKNCPIN